MGFLTGKTQQLDTTAPDVRGLRSDLISTLMAGLPGMRNSLFGMGQGSQGFSALDPSIVKPYSDLFAAQRGDALAQAKESAGNLTGSGYNNILGTSLAGSLAQQQATLANLGLQNQQFQMQQHQNFLNAILGLSTQQQPTVYQPGFLDYAVQGAAAAAPFFSRLGRGTPSAPGAVSGGVVPSGYAGIL